MVVQVVAPWAERAGGAEEMLWTMLNELDRSLISPELVFLRDGSLVQEVRSVGVRADVVPTGRLRQVPSYVSAVTRLSQLVRQRRPDVVLAWSAKAHLYAGVAAAIARVPAVWWQHAIPDGHWIDRLATMVPARAVGCSSVACAAGQSLVRPRRRTFVVHPGIDVDRRRPSVSRSELGLPPDAFVVGVVGRLQPWKRQDTVIRTTRELRLQGIPACALIVGGEAFGLSPGYGEDLRRLVQELGLEAHVKFTGQVADARPYYAVMDACVNASDAEPFGITVLEAMAVGVPVVARRRGGPSEIIDDERTGLLADDDLTGALARLAHDHELRTRLGEAGRGEVEERFTAKGAAQSLARELRNTAATGLLV
jgi:glycosyltransferase involved in cell wall biosynthesis